ncbi:MAG: hypothetical protein ISQ08_10420 [Planctomycetes bacterium]|nr:hypothetical protein [Planctomycetota bacterium]
MVLTSARPVGWIRLLLLPGVLVAALTALAWQRVERAVASLEVALALQAERLEVEVAGELLLRWREHGGDPAREGLPLPAWEQLRAGLRPVAAPVQPGLLSAVGGVQLELQVDLPMPILTGGEEQVLPMARAVDLKIELRAVSRGLAPEWSREVHARGGWSDQAVLRALERHLPPAGTTADAGSQAG